MPARSTSFQRLITAIHTCSSGVRKVKESAMLIDMDTGESREVDILITSQEASYDFLVGVEVIEHSRKADVTWVEKMIQKHSRLPTNKLVLISKSGFSKQAVKKANAHNVEALELSFAQNVNWELATKLAAGGVFKLLNIDWKCELMLVGCTEWIVPMNEDFIHLTEGEQPVSVGAFAQYLVNLPFTRDTIFQHLENNYQEDFHMVFSHEGSVYISSKCFRFEIDQICISLKIKYESNPFSFSVRKLKESIYGVGETIEENKNFCFAISIGTDGKTKGVVYDNHKIRELSEYN